MVPRTSQAAAVADPGTEVPGETVGKVACPSMTGKVWGCVRMCWAGTPRAPRSYGTAQREIYRATYPARKRTKNVHRVPPGPPPSTEGWFTNRHTNAVH